MGTAAVSLDQVTLSRGGRAVLEQFNLSVAKGEIVSILGPSGRGKTTLLHAIAGLIQADTGEIHLDSQPGLSFQDNLLLPWLTVRQNVALAFQFKAHYRGADADVVSQRITEIIHAVGISELEANFPHELSGGQAQRVSIARSLVVNSEILLLDEPFSSVDAVTRTQLQELVRSTRQQLGTTVIVVTHDITEALAISDRVIVLAESSKTLELHPDQNQEAEQAAQILLALGGNYDI
jgi:ABC-type nitrate/sulfonate/bicarbonate transport system ATPase subunit